MSGLTALRDATYTMVAETGAVLGTCFRAPILDSTRPGTYLLTAGHAITHLNPHNPIRVVGGAGEHDAEPLRGGTGADPDVGLLYVAHALGPPLPCAVDRLDGPIRIRGSPSGLATQLATLRGWSAGTETLGPHRYIDVVLPDLGLLETPRSSSSSPTSLAYSALRGLSGAPVCAATRDAAATELPVIGIVVRRNTAGVANHVYAVPMSVVATFLGSNGHVLQLARSAPRDTASAGLLTGRLIRRLLHVPGGMHQLWEDTSELFYAGVPVDAVLDDVLTDPTRYGFDAPLQLAGLRFLLARLMLKRGRTTRGIELLHQARGNVRQGRDTETRRLSALIDLRSLMHSNPGSTFSRRQTAFDHGLGRFEEVAGMSDEDRAYEVASALGNEAAELVHLAGFGPETWPVRCRFQRLRDQHSALLGSHPATLVDKQEIVHIALTLMDALWDTIAARISGESARAFALLTLVGAALSGTCLDLSQEGIRSNVSYLDRTDPVAAHLLRTVHTIGIPGAATARWAPGIDTTPADRSAMTTALHHCKSIAPDISGIATLFALPHDLLQPLS